MKASNSCTRLAEAAALTGLSSAGYLAVCLLTSPPPESLSMHLKLLKAFRLRFNRSRSSFPLRIVRFFFAHFSRFGESFSLFPRSLDSPVKHRRSPEARRCEHACSWRSVWPRLPAAHGEKQNTLKFLRCSPCCCLSNCTSLELCGEGVVI